LEYASYFEYRQVDPRDYARFVVPPYLRKALARAQGARLEGLAPHKRLLKKALLSLYRANYKFWNRVTTSAVHAPSPMIFGYEVRALARR